ncbi:MAG: FliI/YscN family ATPase [Acidimicrobiia bacterium]|nr:FliI/YscN family ATPase [Acidimicrobiia bacterium]
MSHVVLDRISPFLVTGQVTAVAGLEIIVSGLDVPVGAMVTIGAEKIPADVVAVRPGECVVMPLRETRGISAGDPVERCERLSLVLGEGLRGRVIGALGAPLDDKGPIEGHTESVSSEGLVPNPMTRQRISEPLGLGVRAIDSILPCGRGQRIGIFAGSGVGKSSLLGMMARGTQADVVVVGLVGERGREVREFIEDDLGPEGMENTVVVVSTSDEPAPTRIRAAFTATRVAEWFAAQGQNVLLLMDSVTRVAMAQREVGLTAGEPPTTRGFPPSVFALLPQLLERAGPLSIGSITGVYTVLVEGDDLNEPVTDHVRSILDGHVVLSRDLAAAGHFPTIDILNSVSRLAAKVAEPQHLADAALLRRLLVAWDSGRDLVELGAYAEGTNEDLDAYLTLRKPFESFLQQDLHDVIDRESALHDLRAIADAIETLSQPKPGVPA